jgi:two-component system, LuxR family, sensor kinase FixL
MRFLTPPDPAVLLNRRSFAGLALIGLLVLANQLIVQPPLLRLMTDAPLINVAGRQRMYSQRLAKEALAMEAATTQAARRQRRENLESVLQNWASIHLMLRDDDKRRSGGATGAVAREFDRLEPHFRRIQTAAALLVADDSAAKDRERLQAILDSEGEFLQGMERIVGLYEARASERVNSLIAMGWALAALIVVGLAAMVAFVLRPASRLIERQLTKLNEARGALEIRVSERTAAFERANADLARAADERSKAEERQRVLVEQFSHVARATTVGEMASGLAHELNQPLGAIANYAEGCLVALDAASPPIDEIRGVLRKILAASLRAGAIVLRVRRFVTRQGPVRELVATDRLAREVAEFFGDEAKRRGVDLRVDVAPNVPLVWGDPIQIQQVLMNLVRNAFDAVPAAQHPAPTVLLATRSLPDGAAELAVSDSGHGIPPNQLERIFDAYFSTRDDGMGMGLAISRTIAAAHQGRIEVDSTPGVGTTFRLTLPAVSGDDGGTDGLHR